MAVATSWDDIPDKKKGVAKSWDDIPDKKGAPARAVASSWDDIPDKRAPAKPPVKDNRPLTADRTRSPIDIRTGRVINPDTGLPYPKPGQRAPEAPARENDIIAGLKGAVLDPLLGGVTLGQGPKVAGALNPLGATVIGQGATMSPTIQRALTTAGATLYPVREVVNSIARVIATQKPHKPFEKMTFEEQRAHNRRAFGLVMEGLKQSKPWQAFVKGLGGEATDVQAFQILAKHNPRIMKDMKRIGGPAVADFIVSFPLDAPTGHLQAMAAGGLAKLGPPLQKVAEAKIPALGKYAEGRRAFRATQREYSMGLGAAEQHGRELSDIARDVEKTTASQKAAGAKVRAVDPVTKLPVNVLDDLVADYIEAGAKGARHEALLAARPTKTAPVSAQRAAARAQRSRELPQIQARAAQHRIDYAEVERLGKRYQALGDKIGQELVSTGSLSKEAFNRLRGFHLPRYYMLRSLKPTEAEKLLQGMESKGLLTAEAAGDLRRGFDAPRERGYDFSTAREIETFGERIDPSVGRLAAPGATPAFARYTLSAQREIGEARAMQALAKNPELAVSRAGATPEQLSQWKRVPGETPLKDMLVHPGVLRYIQERKAALEAPHGPWQTFNKSIRRWWLGTPRTAWNNAAGNVALGNATVNVNGIERSIPQTIARYGKAMVDLNRAAKGKVDPTVQLAWDLGVLSEGSGIIPSGARDFGAGFGVETLGEKLRKAPGQLARYEHPIQEWLSRKGFREPEAGARLYVFREMLEAGKTPEEAARITHAAMIDYSAVGPAIRWAEQNNLSPFIVFPLRAVFQFANVAARRPDVFQTLSGERLRVLADEMADERSGGRARARERRKAGQVSPFEFPLPGATDQYGQQTYVRAPFLAPALQLFPATPDANLLTGTLQERLKSLMPIPRTLVELGTNRATFTGKPIWDEGLPPTSIEPAQQGGLHALKGIWPGVRDAETLYHALTGTSAAPSPFSPVPNWYDALLSFTMGVKAREGAADTPGQSRERAGERAGDAEHKHYQDYAAKYLEKLQNKQVPIDPRLIESARKLQGFELNKSRKKASDTYKNLLTTANKSGTTREKAIEAQLQWIFALQQASGEAQGREAAVGPLGVP